MSVPDYDRAFWWYELPNPDDDRCEECGANAQEDCWPWCGQAPDEHGEAVEATYEEYLVDEFRGITR